MKCPECKGKLKVLDIVHDEENLETYRLKKCKECGHSLYTIEMEVLCVDEKFKRTWKRNHRYNKK